MSFKSLFKTIIKTSSITSLGISSLVAFTSPSKAENFNIFDIAGNKFIDFTSTIFVSNTGHSNPRIKKYHINWFDDY